MAIEGKGSHGVDQDPHGAVAQGGLAERLNWLRAGVLGANDGIISTAGLVIGVAAASADSTAIATAGVAGLVAGAVSMALGEYVSVSAQRDTEQALIEVEKRELQEAPHAEQKELEGMLLQRGLSQEAARMVAAELEGHHALDAHLRLELGIDHRSIAKPWVAAFSSAVAFTLGSVLPLVAILAPPDSLRIPVAFVAVLLALALTGAVSAYLGQASKRVAVLRLVAGGALAMAITFAIGELLDVAVA